MNGRWLELLGSCWRALRAVSGDDVYERYLQHQQRYHPQCAPLNRSAFYLNEQERRFNGGPNRCC